jgi:hypothetical protein
MRHPLAALVLLSFAAIAAAPAHAQSTDPIAALLDQRGQEGDDPYAPPDPDAAAPPPAGVPAAPIPYGSTRRPQLTEPVHIDELGKTPDAPPTSRDIAYDSRIKSSFASAQGFQGPLDGGWRLSADGGDLYALQLVDRADRLEGAWGDVRRKGGLNASGLVDDIQRSGSQLILRFTPNAGAVASVATLHAGADGRWSGDLVEGGQRQAVVLRRMGP